MLVSLLVIILAVTFGGTWKIVQGLESTETPVVETADFIVPAEGKTNEIISLKEFENIPRLIEDANPQPPLLWSHSAIAIDIASGKVLYKKDERKKMPIASLTKIMTAIVVDEKIGSWKEDVKISHKATFSGGAGVHFREDEIVEAGDLFKAMVMNSDNTAAIALAEHLAGSEQQFAELMNAKAREIGVQDTNFQEPSGLEDEISYSTAYDVAKIAQYASQKKKIVKTMQIHGPIQVDSCDGLLSHRVGNTNIFLKDEALAPRVIFGKTGFTYNAGYCLMTGMRSKKKQREIIGVILNGDKTMRWEEMQEMINWGFDNYYW
ncbi:MAG: serine hydrolase [Patescibacteria group bacterium]|nr:serine hydrolase [Patescibacteria group bacterium]